MCTPANSNTEEMDIFEAFNDFVNDFDFQLETNTLNSIYSSIVNIEDLNNSESTGDFKIPQALNCRYCSKQLYCSTAKRQHEMSHIKQLLRCALCRRRMKNPIFKIKITLGFILLSFISCVAPKSIGEDHILEEPSMIDTEDSDYEIIPIHRSRIQKRDTSRGIHLSLETFGKHIKLWLEPNDGILATAETPIFYVNPHGVFGSYDGYIKDIVKTLYQDAKEAATMTITQLPNGNFKLDGIIGGQGLSIRPASNKYNYKRYKRFLDNIPESEHDNYTYHIVSKLPQVSDHLKVLKAPSLNTLRSKRSIPNIVYPEVLVVVDYSLFKTFHSQHYDVIKYILAFWNSVDLAYRSLQNPKYRINIAGIVIAEGPKSLRYMQYTRNNPYGLLVRQALLGSAKWILEIDELVREKTDYDAVITLAATEFINDNVDGVITKNVGLAYTRGACSLPRLFDTGKGYVVGNIFMSGIVHDFGGYGNVHVATHELGHLLGANHDGAINQQCSEEIGYLMAPTLSMTANSSDWSYCSVRDLESFLNSQYSECLFNKPKGKTRISRFLPGKILDADEQCKYLGQLRAVKNETMCVTLACQHNDESLRLYAGAADGTPCGENKICLHKQCLDLRKITY